MKAIEQKLSSDAACWKVSKPSFAVVSRGERGLDRPRTPLFELRAHFSAPRIVLALDLGEFLSCHLAPWRWTPDPSARPLFWLLIKRSLLHIIVVRKFLVSRGTGEHPQRRDTKLASIMQSNLGHLNLSLEKLIALGVGAVVSLVSGLRVAQTTCVKVRCDPRRAAIGKAIPLAVYDAAIRLSQLLGGNRGYIDAHLLHRQAAY